jgi:hypothetical protein
VRVSPTGGEQKMAAISGKPYAMRETPNTKAEQYLGLAGEVGFKPQ